MEPLGFIFKFLWLAFSLMLFLFLWSMIVELPEAYFNAHPWINSATSKRACWDECTGYYKY